MKKFIVFIVAILYLALSTGATIHMHYCMDKLVGIALWHNMSKKDDKCSNCGMPKEKNKCCKDEHKHLQIKKDQKINDSYILKVHFSDKEIIQSNFIEFKDQITKSAICVNSYANAPPGDLHTPIYIRIRVFRI